MTGQRIKHLVISDEQPRQRRCQQLCQHRHHDARSAHQLHALAQHILQLRMVLRTEVEADDRRTADRIADVDRDEHELHIQDVYKRQPES